MTREEQLKFCKICKNQKFDAKQGVICGLTNSRADFEKSCDYFNENLELKAQYDLQVKENEILVKTASLGKRFANYVIDLLFFLILSFVIGVILGIVFAIFSPELLYYFEEEHILIEYLMGFTIAMIYYTSFEALTGQTIAKFITKTKVVKKNGEQPGFGTILIRSLCRFIPLEPFSFLGSENSGWHDKLSKTIVIEN